MRAKRVVALLVAALAVYFGLIGYRGLYLLGQRSLTLKVLGAAVLVLPLIGIWVVAAELRFGAATERLARRLEETVDGDDRRGVTDETELPRSAGGRVDRAAADELFERRAAEVQAQPGDWRRWYRLALAYDLAGDRKRARAAMRTAIERAGPA